MPLTLQDELYTWCMVEANDSADCTICGRGTLGHFRGSGGEWGGAVAGFCVLLLLQNGRPSQGEPRNSVTGLTVFRCRPGSQDDDMDIKTNIALDQGVKGLTRKSGFTLGQAVDLQSVWNLRGNRPGLWTTYQSPRNCASTSVYESHRRPLRDYVESYDK